MTRSNGWLKYLISLLFTLLLGVYGYAYMIDTKANRLAENVTSHIVKEEATLEVIQTSMPALLEQIRILNHKLAKPEGGR